MTQRLWKVGRSFGWLVVASAMAGCSTISVRQERSEEDGAEIRGAMRYQLRVAGVESVAAGTMEQITVKSDGAVRICDIERYERTREIQERRRYMSFAGAHSDYSVGSDIFVDPIMAAVWVLISPLLETIAIASFFDEGLPSFGEVNRQLATGIIGILPLVNATSPTGVCETITGKERRRRIEPATRTTSVDPGQLSGTRMRWRFHREDGAELGKGTVKWPAPVIVPWCDWAINNPTSRLFTLTVASDECEVSGTPSIAMPVDILAAARRQWPDVTKALKPSLLIESAALIDGDGREAPLIKAGASAQIKIVVKNVATDGTVAYAVRPVADASPSIVRVSGVGSIDRLLPGDVATVFVAVSVPLGAIDGRSDVHCGILDILQRECARTSVAVAVTHADLPHLVVMPATLRRTTASPGTHELDFVVRNAGAAPAFGVKVEICDVPPGYSMSETLAPLTRVGVGEQRRVVIPLRVGEAAGPLAVSIKLTESRGLDPVVRRLEVPELKPSSVASP